MHSRGGSSYSPPRRTFARQVALRTADLFFLFFTYRLDTYRRKAGAFRLMCSQLPIVQCIMNTVEKTSTGVTPAELILNKSIRLSNRILSPPDSLNPLSQVELSDTMDNWVARQHTLLTVAQVHQLQSDILQSTPFTLTCCSHPVGRGLILPKHRGPFQVMDKSNSIYTIEDLVSDKRITTHIHNLRPFIYDPICANPLTVAQHNK
jgi:hypothetical protein